MNSYKSGLFAEFIARMYLRIHGFSILSNRYITGRYTGRAEVDIIARRRNLILFVEVKNRPSAAAGISAITYDQSIRLRRAAQTWVRASRWTGDARFDVIVVSGWRVKWFKNVI
jgi:putative endonuclease